jgi:hypothetical protein
MPDDPNLICAGRAVLAGTANDDGRDIDYCTGPDFGYYALNFCHLVISDVV